MIPIESRRRLLDTFPSAYQITIGGQTYQRNLNYAWHGEDREPDFPSVELRLDPTGQRRGAVQPLGQFLRNLDVDDPTIALNRLRGERLFDELNVRVAASGEIMDVSAAGRAHIITQMLANYCRFGLTDDIYEPGTGQNELSMTASIVSGPSNITDLVDEIQVPTWQFTVRLNYTATYDVLVDAVEDIQVEYRLVF